MTAVLVFIFVCGLLFVGKIIRVNVSLFQRLYLPSSVIGGILGLLIFSFCGGYIPEEVHNSLSRMPGFLINIVFATMFLGVAIPGFKSVIEVALLHLCLGQIMAWGQYVVGMAMIQWAYKKGYIKSVVSFEDRAAWEKIGLYLKDERPSAGKQTVVCDSIDSLAWHVVIIGVAIGVGYFLYSLIPIKGFPLFPFCMIAGMLIELVSRKTGANMYIDRGQMERISGASLDFLVVSAVATIRLDVVTVNWQPLLILVVAGSLWSIFVVMFFGRRIMYDAWFERSIAEFGQATGVTATGLMLLRTVDPDNKTPAAMAFGYKQLLHEPFLGGGLWTAMAFTLVFTIGWQKVLAISTGMLLFWLICGWLISRNKEMFR